MKKILIILMVLACFAGTAYAALTYDRDNYDNNISVALTRGRNDPLRNFIYEVENVLDGTSSTTITSLLFSQETSAPAATEGMFYYNATSEGVYIRDSDSWNLLAAESGTVSLDVAYNNGNAIDVDGTAVTLDNDTTDENVLLVLTQDDTTSNNDAMTIVVTGTGDALQVTGGATTGGGINMVAYASGLAPLITLDGSTNNWDGADNKGQLLIQADDPYIHAGATALMVLDSSTPIVAAEGFLARFVHSGSPRASTSAVQISVDKAQTALTSNGQVIFTGAGNSAKTTLNVVGNDGTNNTHALDVHNEGTAAAVLITPDDTDTPALLVTGKASSSVTVVTIDGATADWIGGADDVAMVEITGGSTANADAGGGLLAVISATTPAASSEGFLARFIHTGTATTTAHAVEIECTNTQPALMLNNKLTITGVDSTGVLVAITGNDDTGDTDVMTIANGAASDGIQITNSDVLGTAINCIATANQTTSTIIIDGATGNWIGANDIGMLHLTADTQNAHAGATNLFVQATYSPIAASEGFLARFEQKTGAAVTDAYAVEIETTATTPCLKLNGQMTIAGQGATDGVLLDITSADTNDDTVQLTGVGSADVLQITSNATASVGLNIVAKASGTTADLYVDATAGWIGADDVGLVHIESDSALTDNGATLLMVLNTTGQIKAGAEGHLARFVDTAAAQTGSHAVEIETANTTPCLKLNNRLTITGADSATTLVAITGNDTSGNSDTMTINHDGTGSGLKITADGTTSVALELVAATSQTTSVAQIDGTTGSWLGASDVGMLNLTNDGALASVNASLLYIANTGIPTNDSRGSSLRIVDTGNAGGGTAGYAVYIKATDATVEALYVDEGKVQIDEILTTGIGYQSTVVTKVANTDGQTGSTIAPGTRVVHVTGFTANANDWILLPAGVIGQRLTIISDVAHEIRTPAASDDTINDVDADGGANEYAVVLDDINDFVCTGTGASWIAVAHDKLGAAKTIAPDGV